MNGHRPNRGHPAVTPAKNGRERIVRPSFLQDKVTHGSCVMQAADYESAVRSTVETLRLAGAGCFRTILQTKNRLPRRESFRQKERG